jgi:hypothetical protein
MLSLPTTFISVMAVLVRIYKSTGRWRLLRFGNAEAWQLRFLWWWEERLNDNPEQIRPLPSIHPRAATGIQQYQYCLNSENALTRGSYSALKISIEEICPSER